MTPSLRTYEYDSAEYRLALELRKEVLRRPLGLTYTPEQLAAEAGDLHIGAFVGPEVVGTLILTPAGSVAKMRQVAVAAEAQGLGIGRKLVEFAEAEAKRLGFLRIELHARLTAAAFYDRLGYVTEGEIFEEVTLPHQAMYKNL